jgi:predicted acyltransferase (DUF342 family)
MVRCGGSDYPQDDECSNSDHGRANCSTNVTIWRDLRFTYGFGEALVLRTLKVHGAAVVETTLTARNMVVDNDLAVRGDVKIGGDTKIKGDILICGDETIKGKLIVGKVAIAEIDLDGDGNIGGKISVKGDGAFGGNVTVAGDETVKGRLTAGSIVLNEVDTTGDANIGGKLVITKDAAIGGSAAVAGDLVTKTLDVKSSAKIEDALEVDGDATLTGSQTTITGALAVPKSLTLGSNASGVSGFLIDNSFTTSASQTFIRYIATSSQDAFGAPGSTQDTRINAVSANFLCFQARTKPQQQISGGNSGSFTFAFDKSVIPVGKIPFMTGVVGSVFADATNQDATPGNPIGWPSAGFFGVLRFAPQQDFLTSGLTTLSFKCARDMTWLDRWVCGFHISWVWVNPSA